MKRFLIFLTFFLLQVFQAGAQNAPVRLEYTAGSTYYLVERSNWSKYTNGKYIGLTHKETRARIASTGQSGGSRQFSGNFYVLEETLRDMSAASRAIDEIRQSTFTVSPSGEMKFSVDQGYPQLRGFPVYPDKELQTGDSWQAEGFRIIDPKNNGRTTTLPIMVEYVFIGPEEYKGIGVYRIRAKYATRINAYLKRKTDDPDLKSASGTHDVEILVDRNTGAAILILDRLDETFYYTDGGSVRYKGSTALFTETPIPIRKERLVPEITAIVAESVKRGEDVERKKSAEDVFATPPATEAVPAQPVPAQPAPTTVITEKYPSIESAPFEVEQTDQGIRLSVRDIRFQSDSDNILPEERWRLDAIADTLKLVTNGKFLIEGHTASVGKPAGEKELSLKRAQRIAEELSKRGLKSEQFMFAGYGGTRALADNSTAAGRAQNRRVEITILD